MLARVPNDKGLANHASIARTLDVIAYFTRPYTSQDKGTIENRIGVIRFFFSKNTDLRNITEQGIKTVVRYPTNQPIREFDYFSLIQQPLNTALLH